MLQLHLTIGLGAYLVIAFRCVWRFRNGHPAPLPAQGHVFYAIGKAVHYVLLVGIVLMLVSGPCLLLARGYPLTFAGVDLLAGSAGRPGLASVLSRGDAARLGGAGARRGGDQAYGV